MYSDPTSLGRAGNQHALLCCGSVASIRRPWRIPPPPPHQARPVPEVCVRSPGAGIREQTLPRMWGKCVWCIMKRVPNYLRELLVFPLLVVVAILVGCHANPRNDQRILGCWEGNNAEGDCEVFVEFRDDGTGGWAGAGRGTALGEAFRYSLRDGTILIDGQDPTSTPQQWRYAVATHWLEVRFDKEKWTLHPATSDFARGCQREFHEYWDAHSSTRPSN